MRKKTDRCPVCGGEPDGHIYEADDEDQEHDFPPEYEICEHCCCPLVELEGRDEP